MTDKDIFNYHGYREQCEHITGEMYELTEAIYDYENNKNLKNWNHICEEVADIEFMLNQIKENYVIKKQNVNTWLDYKRQRETKRIKEGIMEINRNDLLKVAFILDDVLKKNNIRKYLVQDNELLYWVEGIERGFVIRYK